MRTIKIHYYCRKCLLPYDKIGHCPSCDAELERDLEAAELVRKKAIMRVLGNHRAELIHEIEVERALANEGA